MTTVRFDTLTRETADRGRRRDLALLAFFADDAFRGHLYRPANAPRKRAVAFEVDFENALRLQIWEVDAPTSENPHELVGELRLEPRCDSGCRRLEGGGSAYQVAWTVLPPAERATWPARRGVMPRD